MTFKPRLIDCPANRHDRDGIKLYTISADGRPVDPKPFLLRLDQVKAERGLDWAALPAFAILHRGASRLYLVLCWWSNDNELFNPVSVLTETGWVDDPRQYSFCVYDLEIIWFERQCFIATLDCANPDIAAYRRCHFVPPAQ